jgi:hypothetical protein
MAWITAWITAVGLCGAATSWAHGTACCAPKPCIEVDAEGNCLTPNAGMACVKDPATNAQAVPGRGAVAGCVDGELGVCIGGAATPAGVEGCVGLGAAFVAGTNPQATAEDCTAAAVDACCANGACEVPPPVEE